MDVLHRRSRYEREGELATWPCEHDVEAKDSASGCFYCWLIFANYSLDKIG